MGAPSNEVYSAFSFIGFVMCAIPLYWHLEGMWRYFRCWGTHTENVWHSLEYGNLLVYGLDWHRVPFRKHQLDRVEQKHDQ